MEKLNESLLGDQLFTQNETARWHCTPWGQFERRAGGKGIKLRLCAKSTTFTHIRAHTHIQKRYWPKHMCPVTFHYPAGLLSSDPLRLSRHCVIWGQDAERVYMCYSNNRNSLYYSWVAGKTYGGINLVTLLFNITSPGLGTPQQLENGANHSIKQTAMSYLIYSVLNTIECYYFEYFLQPFIRRSGECNCGLSDIFYLYVLLLCVMYCICELANGVSFCKAAKLFISITYSRQAWRISSQGCGRIKCFWWNWRKQD